MVQSSCKRAALIGIGMIFLVFGAATAIAADAKKADGWETGSTYNKLYKANEADYFKASVVKIKEVVPMKGMSPGVALVVKEAPDEEPIEVHVCPTWYKGKGGIGLKRGDRVKIRGVWTEIEGKDVFMASKIKKGEYFVLKVRLTKDGTPFWTLSADELARETAAVGSQ